SIVSRFILHSSSAPRPWFSLGSMVNTRHQVVQGVGRGKMPESAGPRLARPATAEGHVKTFPCIISGLTRIPGRMKPRLASRHADERRRFPLRERRAVERRREDRRQRDIAKELQTYGWAVVRR